MKRKAKEEAPVGKVKKPRRQPQGKVDPEEEDICLKAHLWLHFEANRPLLWTVADIREERGEDDSRRWILAVHLRYPTGFEGYLGDLIYDGKTFTELTDLDLMRQRARQIAADPEGRRQWEEYRLPILHQEKRNTCALACLRMALAGFGTNVEEATIEAETNLLEEGTEIVELVRARHFGLVTEITEVPIARFGEDFAQDKILLAYIDRAVFDLSPARRAAHRLRAATFHVVIQTRVTASSVYYHDPMPPRITRRSMALFRAAFERIGGRCVVCAKSETAQG